MLSRIAVVLLAALLTACAGSGGPPSTPPSTSASPTPDAVSPSVSPRESPSSAPLTITGVLGSEAVEGGCAYLETNDQTRYEVIYPPGWQATAAPLELRDPDGKVIASGGDSVTVRGQLAVDMASTCQIGPIFRATEVVTSGR